jgi:hypothetical protein
MHGGFTESRVSDAVLDGSDNAVGTIDPALLFQGEFRRHGDDLKIVGADGRTAIIPDYFKSDQRATLYTPDGASLSGDTVEMLAGPRAPGQYAQAGTPASVAALIGTVDKMTGSATVLRGGVSVQLSVGDPVRKGDVILTAGASSVAIILVDGTALNLGADTRMALNEFSYDASSSTNSSLFSLVTGSFAFVAGQVAKTGGLNIDTPVATMGIRGTVGGGACGSGGSCEFYAAQDIGGQPSSYTLYSGGTFVNGQYVGGSVVGTVTVGSSAIVSPSGAGQLPQVTFVPAANADPALAALAAQLVQFYPGMFAPAPSPPGSSTPPDVLDDGQPPPQRQTFNFQPDQIVTTLLDPLTGAPVVTNVTFVPPPISTQQPVVDHPNSNQTSAEDQPWIFSVPADTFSDPDGTALTFSARLADGSELPAWLTFDPATRTFSGTPPQDFNGAIGLQVVASDGTSSVASLFTLTVTPVNDAPALAAAVADQSSPAGETWIFEIPSGTFSDVDGDALTYTARLADGGDLPSWLTFDASTRTFSGTPPQDLVDDIDLQIFASDGAASASDMFTLTVFVRDEFPAQAYNGWIEGANDGGSATSGEIQVAHDPATAAGNFQLRLSDLDAESDSPDTVQRTMDLSGLTSAQLTFDYRRDIPIGDASDEFFVLVSTDGVTFDQIGQIGATGNGSFVDGAYQTFTFDLTPYISANTTIQFSVGDGVDNGDVVYVDNFQVAPQGFLLG